MRYKFIITVISIITTVFVVEFTAYAQPYGAGVYNSNIPYGNQTSLSISAVSAVNLSINPASVGTLGTASGPVTVTSTDVVGYKLYIRAVGTTAMTNGVASIPASNNVAAAPIAVNTWGYNTTGSANFIGVSTIDTLLNTGSGPYSSGDITTVTYGLNIDRSKSSGQYSSNIIYTAVPQTN